MNRRFIGKNTQKSPYMGINSYFCKPKMKRMDALSPVRLLVESELNSYRQLFEAALTHEDDYLGRVLDHVKSRRGKMMRPLLVLLVARELGPVGEATLRSAVALELLHTASLVHDDVVDQSDERRGQPSANAAYGNKVAVLVGDYLLSSALHQTALTGSTHSVELIARLGATLSEGEVRQLANIRNAVSTEEAYYDIIRSKTAALFAACGQLGAFTAGAGAEFEERARRFGELVGMCFQIRDDIFDYYEKADIGKPTGNDMAEGKLTLPAIYALSRPDVEPEAGRIAARVKEGTATRDEIAQLVDFTLRYGGIDYARSVMMRFHDEAAVLLAGFRSDDVRRALGLYLDYVVGRDF